MAVDAHQSQPSRIIAGLHTVQQAGRRGPDRAAASDKWFCHDWKVWCCSESCASNEKSDEPTPLPRPLRQGTEEQRLASPILGRGTKSLHLRFKSPLRLQGRNFSESRLEARRLSCHWLALGFDCSFSVSRATPPK